MRVLQISADRSPRGLLHSGTPAFARQQAYAKRFGNLDIIAFSRQTDSAQKIDAGPLRIFPVNAIHPLLYAFLAIHIARRLPKPDVITAQDPFETGLVALMIAHLHKRPLHIQVHTDVFDPAYARHSFANRLRAVLARYVLSRATRIRTVSHRAEAHLRAAGIRAPITVLPIFVDVSGAAHGTTFSPFLAHFQTKVLVVARLEPEKNVSLAIRAFAQGAPPSACLIIVGQGSERQMLERLAATLGIADRVFFERGEAAPFFALADLLLVPSRYEGYGLVIMEALAAGLPVIATDVGVAKEAGAIVADHYQFADTLASWFTDGPRTMSLQSYPYRSFDEYVAAYVDDVASCMKGGK